MCFVYLILFYSNFLSQSCKSSLLLTYRLNSSYSFLLPKIALSHPPDEPSIFQVLSSKLYMHRAEGVNATETELLDRKGAVGKNRRKSGGTLFRPEASNESGIEWRTKWKLQLVLL